MRIAVYSSRKDWNTYMKAGLHMYRENMEPLEIDDFCSHDRFCLAVQKRKYDLIVMDNPAQEKINWGRLLQELDQLCKGIVKNSSRQVWRFRKKMIVLEHQEIYYILSVQKSVRVYGKNNSYQISTSMKQEEEKLAGKGFLRIHRNCLVNLMHVRKMDGSCLVLRNGVRLLVSCRRKNQVKQQILSLKEAAE